MSETLKLNELPEILSITDIASYMRMDLESARHFARQHRQALKPFKVGRENRFPAREFKIFVSRLQEAAQPKIMEESHT